MYFVDDFSVAYWCVLGVYTVYRCKYLHFDDLAILTAIILSVIPIRIRRQVLEIYFD